MSLLSYHPDDPSWNTSHSGAIDGNIANWGGGFGAWDYDSLNKFLWKPKKFVVGTKMNYLGIKKPADRAAMVAWLRTLSPSPVALPSGGQIAAEAAELAPVVEEAVSGAVDAVIDAAPAVHH